MAEHRAFGPEDDDLHRAELGDRWWATETAWFSFHDPARRLGGWLYTMIRPNIGTVAGGVWVWDDTAWLPWDVLYSANYSALQLPPDTDLRNTTLPTGVSIRALEPTMSYALGYDDGDRLRLDLRFDGVMAPEPLTAVGSTFGSAHHFDQFGRVTGTVDVLGERVAIDCISMRDRTWGPRPEHRPRQAHYVTGAADRDHGFLAVTNAETVDGDDDPVAYGFLRRDGRTVALTDGRRRALRHPTQGWIERIELDATDADGRQLRAVGEPVSRMIVNRHTFIDINSVVRWDVGDVSRASPRASERSGTVEAWGEDQDMWPVHAFAAARRRSFGASP